MSAHPLFGHHRDAVWDKLSQEIGGEHLDHKGWRQDKVQAQVDEWTVTLDLHAEPGYKAETIYTRFRAPFVNSDNFQFTICHEGLFANIAQFFGKNDVQTGHSEFDEMFLIKSNDEARIKAMFSNPRLRELMKTEPDIHLLIRNSGDWFQDRYPEGVDELVLEVEGEVGKLVRLRKLFHLFSEVLHTIGHHGSAYDDDPERCGA